MQQEMRRAAQAASVRQSSNREFGYVMAVFFLIVSAVSAWKRRDFPPVAYPAISVAFLLVTLTCPSLLKPLNKAWTIFGKILHTVISPLILGTLYFGVFTPFGFAFRLFQRDALRLRLDPAASSYWIARDPASQPGKGMGNQH